MNKTAIIIAAVIVLAIVGFAIFHKKKKKRSGKVTDLATDDGHFDTEEDTHNADINAWMGNGSGGFGIWAGVDGNSGGEGVYA